MQTVELNDLQGLLTALQGSGFTVIGPTVRDGAITFETISSVEELPHGWTDVQEAGTYGIRRREDDALFSFSVGPHSWKKFLFPARLRLFTAKRSGKGFTVDSGPPSAPPRYAFFGVRSCELAAIAIQDKIFMTGVYADTHYTSLRKAACIIAVNCVHVGGTCFCESMGTGPRAKSGYDLAITEVLNADRHYFLVQAGSDTGHKILQKVKHRPAEESEVKEAENLLLAASEKMGRTLDTTNLPRILQDNFEHPRWDDIAKRCLSCANCTMVCPTCFCSTVEDVTDLAGDQAERSRRWDSCFTTDFTRVAGGNVRMSTRTRYRQWLTHKLSNWVEQFGTFGCVGCGRCITWCPVGIDITAEATAIRETTMTSING
jgi:ferredoxin